MPYVLEQAQEADFTMEVIQCLHEVVRILRTDAEVILNSNYEFHQAPSVGVVATNGLQKEQTSAAS